MAVGKKFGGREKGTPNKNTYYVRECFKELVEGEVDNLRARLQLLSDKDYFNVILKMAEFFTPKYQSVAVTVEDNKSDIMVTLMALRDNKGEGESSVAAVEGCCATVERGRASVE